MSPCMAKGTLQMCLIYESWEYCPIVYTITRVLIRERQSETGLQQSRRQCRDRHRLQWCALKMGEGATRQGKQVATQSWKGQGNGFSSTRNQPCTVLSYEVWGNLLQQQQETNPAHKAEARETPSTSSQLLCKYYCIYHLNDFQIQFLFFTHINTASSHLV